MLGSTHGVMLARHHVGPGESLRRSGLYLARCIYLRTNTLGRDTSDVGFVYYYSRVQQGQIVAAKINSDAEEVGCLLSTKAGLV